MALSASAGMESTMEKIKVLNAKEIWNQKLPDDLPREIKCRFCGEPKQLIRVNDRIAFWVHLDREQFKKCKYLTFRTTFIKNACEIYREIQKKLKFHKKEGKNAE